MDTRLEGQYKVHYLNISVRYQLSDEFKNPTGWGFEYGKPYNLMESSKTDTVLRKTFNSNDEYLKFLKDYNIEENSKKRWCYEKKSIILFFDIFRSFYSKKYIL